MTVVYFNGEEGRLEGEYQQSSHPEPQVALILHSEASRGGSMQDPVVQNMYNLFARNNFSVLKINFRGVGCSKGVSTKEEGEIKDATAAIDWLHSKNMESKDFWVIGYSFGAWITFQLAMRRPEIHEYILISPLPKKDLGFIMPCSAGGLIIQGEKDAIATEEQTSKLIRNLSVKEELNVNYTVVEGANHDFEGHQDKLRDVVQEYIYKSTMDNMSRVVKVKRDRRCRRRKKVVDDDLIVHMPAVKKLDFD